MHYELTRQHKPGERRVPDVDGPHPTGRDRGCRPNTPSPSGPREATSLRPRTAVVVRLLLALVVLGVVAVGCGDGGLEGGAASSGTPSQADDSQADDSQADDSQADGSESGAPTARILRILVTNDDGIGGDGIDALVTALDELDGVELVLVAPAANQSGTGGQTSDPVPPVAAATTVSGHDGFAVSGFPADAVAAAFELPDHDYDLVISGINAGQNLGPAVDLSGTVGAARAAAQRGVPALAVSQGITGGVAEPDFGSGVEVVLEWLELNRESLPEPTPGTPTTAWNLNVPTCPSGEPGETVEVPIAAEAGTRDVTKVSCDGGASAQPADDIDGFTAGLVTLSDVSPVN